MAIQVPPTRVPDPGPPARLAAGVLVVSLALVVGLGVIGRSPTASRPAPEVATASPGAAIVASPLPDSVAPPEPTPWAGPAVEPRAGVPIVTRTTSARLAEPGTLVPSGIETLSPASGTVWRRVADGRGVLWAIDARAVTRYDPASGAWRRWTVDDDARFDARDIVPSHTGGVWLIGTRTLRRFDGSGFREAFDVGVEISVATEGPDGTVWAATIDGAIVHLQDAWQTRIDALPPNADIRITALAVDAAGDAWFGWERPWGWGDGVAWVSRYDGATWQVMDAQDAARPGSRVETIAALPDGSVWVVDRRRLLRFDGSVEEDVTAAEPLRGNPPSVAAAGTDGAFWIVAGDRIGRFVGREWRPFASVANLTDGGGVDSIMPTADGVFVTSAGSLFRRSPDGWQCIRSPKPEAAGPQGAQSLVAISRDEVWAADGGEAWRLENGAWSGTDSLGEAISALRPTPDGSLWVTPDMGPARVWRGATWTAVGAIARALAVGVDGVVWVAGNEYSDEPAWFVGAFGFDGRTWTERGRTTSTDLIAWPTRLAVGHDGTIWAGSPGGNAAGYYGPNPGLVCYRDGAWDLVRPRGGDASFAVDDLAIAADGAVWVAATDLTTTLEGALVEGDRWIARYDGIRWVVYGPDDGLRLGSVSAIAAAPDGLIWAATADGLAQFDGTTWVIRYRGMAFSAVAVAPDGTTWVSGPSGVARLAAATTGP